MNRNNNTKIPCVIEVINYGRYNIYRLLDCDLKSFISRRSFESEKKAKEEAESLGYSVVTTLYRAGSKI